MGCSASRPQTFITQQQNPTSNSQLQFPFSDPSSTPVSRILSLPTPLIHHPPLCKGDSNHFVSLTSTTYGSLVLMDSPDLNFADKDSANPTAQMKKIHDFGKSEDPLSQDSVINTWELMEGLDDDEFNFHIVDSPQKPNNRDMDASELVDSYEFVEHAESKPLWRQLSEESLLVKRDSNVVFSDSHGCDMSRNISKPTKIESLEPNNASFSLPDCNDSCYLPGAEDRIVLYHTTLRGIRKTYEDCCAVRVIFRGFRVCLDERDLSMDLSYREELKDALKGKAISLPQVFIRGESIGGAEEIKLLNDAGALAKLVEGFPLVELGFACETCGDARFVPCPNCNGSRKVYEDEEGRLRRCLDCNENSLIRCTDCCP